DAFRSRAATITETDFPELAELADGGVFAMRLDEIVPPQLRPLDDVRDEVKADWRRAERQRQLLELADHLAVAAVASNVIIPVVRPEIAPDAQITGKEDAIDAEDDETERALTATRAEDLWTTETGLTRDAWLDGLPHALLEAAFSIGEPGRVEVVDAEDRVFLIRLDAVKDADLSSADATTIHDRVAARLGQSLQADIFDYYARQVQRDSRIEVDQAAINAINTQVQ
ncbi:MAG: peptidylprolyl isomerase, partial [Paracoccus sp. (in: a-proteobacteria)]|nr:peptidylprolyl isomerase [Paracoccus sp. (in: a-proteobacteria)]